MNELIYYDQITQSLSRATYHAQANLKNVLGLLKITICDSMWRKRIVGITGQVVEFETFEQYVNAKPPEGLGTDMATLRWLCLSDPELLKLIGEASQIKPNIKKGLSQTQPQVLKFARFSKEWTIERLMDTGRGDLIKKLNSGKMTPFAVQVEMGWRKKPKKSVKAGSD